MHMQTVEKVTARNAHTRGKEIRVTDHETTAAIDALAHRLRNREPGTDDEVFALEFITALRGRGWRPTEARSQRPWQRAIAPPPPDIAEHGAALARELLAQHGRGSE